MRAMPKIRTVLLGGVATAALVYLAGAAALRAWRGPAMRLDAGGPPADDLAVLHRVERVLFPMPDHAAISAEVVDGGLVLRGEVADYGRSRDIAVVEAAVQDVTSVDNRQRPRVPEP